MKVLIIGCGLIGRKRALALAPDDRLVACCDTNAFALDRFAAEFKCEKFQDSGTALQESGCEIVIVAVVNKFVRDIVAASLRAGFHVLAEKPLGRNFEEALDIVKLSSGRLQLNRLIPAIERVADPSDLTLPFLKTGFNHRFHPGLNVAKQLVDRGEIGEIMTIRAHYGHGGRPGMEKEWRTSRDLCGGGELLDQGVHIVDLIRWFGGEIKSVQGKVETRFWNIEVEDSAFAILTTETNVTASFHVSWFNWKNAFSFEVFGKEGYINVNGLGGNYGAEVLEFGRRRKEGGRPEVEYFEFPPEDSSWKEEWGEFRDAIRAGREPLANGYDGLMANAVIQKIYESSRVHCEMSL